MLSHARELVEGILAEGEEGLLDPELIAEINKAFPGIQNI